MTDFDRGSNQGGDILSEVSSPFSELSVAKRKNIISLDSVYPLSTLRNVTSGTISSTNGEYKLATGATLETAEFGRYVPGYAAEAGIGIRIASQPAGQVARWGYYDTDNGYLWELNDGSLSIKIRRDGTETSIAQADWNLDPLDGSGPSGINLDFSQGNIFQVRFTWYGYGQIEWGILASLGTDRQEFLPIHRQKQQGENSIANPNLPITAEVNTAGEAFVGGRQFSIIGDYDPPQRITSVIQTEKTVPNTFVPLCSFRRKSGADFTPVSIIANGYDVITDTDMEVGLLVGTTLSTSASFGTPANRSTGETAIEVDTASTSVSGGESVSHILAASGVNNRDTERADTNLSVRIPRQQIVTLVARRFTGLTDATVRAVLRAAEEF